MAVARFNVWTGICRLDKLQFGFGYGWSRAILPARETSKVVQNMNKVEFGKRAMDKQKLLP
jgi:hypothetical protein